MQKAYIGEIAPHVGQTVVLEGWVYNFRTRIRLSDHFHIAR